jgi:phosphoribosylaminoimidazole-succinocarboxamide synthase
MDKKQFIRQNLKSVLDNTFFEKLPNYYKGKVRDRYEVDGKMVMIVTDRQSAFDVNIGLIPFKGQVLNLISKWWFDQTKDIVGNHVVSVPDPNCMIVKKLKMFPVEVVVRGYITGVTNTAMWFNYEQGERIFCGNVLEEGLVKNQKLLEPIITPTTKDEEHDEKISAEEIVSRGLVSKENWDKISEYALALFKRGQELASEKGLILVDTKYEFGEDEDGNILVADEVHTPDSSRYWMKDTYQEKFDRGEEPDSFDKEYLRLWLREHGFEYGKEAPKITDELIIEFSSRYIDVYEKMTGEKFEFPDTSSSVKERITENLKKEFSDYL